MIRQISALLFVAITGTCSAQVKALTESGKEVVLYDNGTWKYLNDSAEVKSTDSIPLNKEKFSKPKGASFLVKSEVFNIGVYINPNKWSFSGRKDNERNPEFRFAQKNGDGNVMLITEKTAINLELMRDIALTNARKASVDVRETGCEYRMVNGIKVLCLEMRGTIKGIKFVYFGYYFCSENGTAQLVSYAEERLFNGAKEEMEDFLGGLTELKK